jgi:hypothetical protein
MAVLADMYYVLREIHRKRIHISEREVHHNLEIRRRGEKINKAEDIRRM